MCQRYNDNYKKTYASFDDFLEDLKKIDEETVFIEPTISTIVATPIRVFSEDGLKGFSGYTDIDAVIDSVGIGIALTVNGEKMPLRTTAINSMLERAKIKGESLDLMSKEELCSILNTCFSLYDKSALCLIRDKKISALHSSRYAVLPQSELVTALKECLDSKFLGSVFESGYYSHDFTSCEFRMPKQKEALLKPYLDRLYKCGKAVMASSMVPGVRFKTSDVSQSAARVAAYIYGPERPILVGSCLDVVHKGKSKTEDFNNKVKLLFSNYTKTINELQALMDVEIIYPVATLTRVCKSLGLPKSESIDAINIFAAGIGDDTATAHDLYFALQEILYNCEVAGYGFEKMLKIEENITRSIKINWKAFDLTPTFSW